MKIFYIFLFLVSILLMGNSCLPQRTVNVNQPVDSSAGLANPASVYCQNQGGNLEMRTSEGGGQFGVCIFSDGSECEEWVYFRHQCLPAQNFSEEKSKEIAQSWIISKSPTYLFDGFDLNYQETIIFKRPSCYQLIFTFSSRQAGYGDRTGQILAQVITPHQIVVAVETGRVISAVTDEKYDEIKQKLLQSAEDTPPPSSGCGR